MQAISRPAGATAPLPPEPPARAIPIAASVIAVLALSSYIWWRNYPNLALKVAAGHAGIEASLPGYLPSGYSLNGPINTSDGKITLNFTDSATDKPLILTYQKTNWDSQGLLENYVTKVTDNYLTEQSQGLTIYIYNGNQASWINKGIWYSIEGNTSLSRDQVTKIANSL